MVESDRMDPIIEREPSPDRFLTMFSEVSGLRLLSQLSKQEDATKPRYGLSGSVVVGSCTRPDSNPKDLDVVLFFNGPLRSYLEEMIEELKFNFDMAFFQKSGKMRIGLLDIIGAIDENNSISVPWIPLALQGANQRIVYSASLQEAEALNQRINFLTGMVY